MASYRSSNWASAKVGKQYYHQRAGNAAFADVKARLRALQVSVAHDIAAAAAPAITELAQQAYDSGRGVYGDARPAGVKGNQLTLVRSGQTRSTVRFVANGRIIRCVLGTPYARYLIGKYGILPNGAIPAAWAARINSVASEVIGS